MPTVQLAVGCLLIPRLLQHGRPRPHLVCDGRGHPGRTPRRRQRHQGAAQSRLPIGPTISGALLSQSAFGWPLVAAGSLKIVYDLTLLRMFQDVKPPEERELES